MPVYLCATQLGKMEARDNSLTFLSGYSWKDKRATDDETRTMDDRKLHVKTRPFGHKLNVCIHFLSTCL